MNPFMAIEIAEWNALSEKQRKMSPTNIETILNIMCTELPPPEDRYLTEITSQNGKLISTSKTMRSFKANATIQP